MTGFLGSASGASLEDLAIVMQTAAAIVARMRPEAVELLRLLAPLPPDARGLLMDVLEREVAARNASLAAGNGLVGPLDRDSQLFLRVYEGTVPAVAVTPHDVYRSSLGGVLRLAGFPAGRVASVIDGVADGIAASGATERDFFVTMVRSLVDTLEQSIAQDGAE